MRKVCLFLASYVLAFSTVSAQQPATPPNPADDTGGKRILWVIPNFRTSPTLNPYVPIAPKEKFKIASQDSFDRGTIALAAAFAGQSMLSNSNRSFGEGVPGYAKYFGAAYGDFVIGNYMTEGVFPTLLHQDPRYFRRGKGKGLARLGYATSRIFVTVHDSGRLEPNYSELLGNSAAVAISMAYYRENRDVGDAVSKLGGQLAVDMASNVIKEFWPDLSRKFSKKHN